MATAIVPSAADAGRRMTGTICIVGGYYDRYDSPVLIPFEGMWLIGTKERVGPRGNFRHVPVLRLFDPNTGQLNQLRIEGLPEGRFPLVGFSFGREVLIGYGDGLERSVDLKLWTRVGGLKGRVLRGLFEHSGHLWVATEEALVEFEGINMLRQIPIPGRKIVGVHQSGPAILVATVFQGNPPDEHCDDYPVSDGFEVFDAPTGRISRVTVEGKSEAQALISVSQGSRLNHELFFSDGKFSDSSYRLRLNPTSIAKSSGSFKRDFPDIWMRRYKAISTNAMARLIEGLISTAGALDFRTLQEAVGWLNRNASGLNWRQLYIQMSADNRGPILEILRREKSPALESLLSLAVERGDRLDGNLARLISLQSTSTKPDLLRTFLRDSATKASKDSDESVEAPASAARHLLEAVGDSAIPFIEDIIEQESISTEVRDAVEWEILSRSRTGYVPRRVRRAEEARGVAAIKFLDSPDWHVRFAAIQHLRYEAHVVPFEKLVALLDDPRFEVAHCAVEAIARSSAPTAVQVLHETFQSGRPELRGAALRGLGLTRDPSAFTLLVSALEDPHEKFSSSAALGLGLLGDRRAVRRLLEYVAKADPQAERAAAAAVEAIGSIGDASAIEPLKAIRTESPLIRNEILRAVQILEVARRRK